jgi:signal transduction histidine kinase
VTSGRGGLPDGTIGAAGAAIAPAPPEPRSVDPPGVAGWTTADRSAVELPARFIAAAIAAAAVLGLATVLLILARPARLQELVPILFAGGALCLGLLARHRAQGLGWASLVVASLVAASVPISLSRAADPGALGLDTWLVVAGRSTAAAIITLAIAALYATRPERRAGRRVTTLAMLLVAWLSTGCLAILLLVVAGARADPDLTWVDIATRPTALFVDVVLLLAAFGVAGDVRAAALRADTRLAAGRDWRGSAAPRPTPLGERIRATLRELVPGEADAEAAAIDAERTRLAGDLHAVVLPSLRRAIAEVEGGAPIETLADRLRTVDLELERLMADRWPVVLEAFGLVEALEDLAERTESEAGVQVALEVGTIGERPRPEVERTAWRVAQVALDNAVRHASAAEIRISVSTSNEQVRLEIADDGTGIDPAAAAAAARSGARGLVDLSRRAAAVGASVKVEAGQTSGTIVHFRWPAEA